MAATRQKFQIPSTHRYRALLCSQVAILLAYPYVDASRAGGKALGLLLTATCIAGLFAAAGGRLPRIGTALAVPAIVGMWLALEDLTWAAPAVALACEGALFLFVAFRIGMHIFRNEEVTEDTISGAVCIYLFIGLAFAALYTAFQRILPGSFQFTGTHGGATEVIWPDFVHFSFVTLTTTGYGDVVPVTDRARSLTLVEYVVGVFYPTILVARLVSLYKVKGRSGG